MYACARAYAVCLCVRAREVVCECVMMVLLLGRLFLGSFFYLRSAFFSVEQEAVDIVAQMDVNVAESVLLFCFSLSKECLLLFET